jgi:choline kinase
MAVKSYHYAVINGLKNYFKMDKIKTLGKEVGVTIDTKFQFEFLVERRS